MAWNDSKNTTFFARMEALARSVQDAREEAARLVDLWNKESVSGDGSFVDVGGITTTEATAMVTFCQDYELFLDNGAISQGDRVATLAKFLASRG